MAFEDDLKKVKPEEAEDYAGRHPEWKERTWKDIKAIGEATEKMISHPEATPICGSPGSINRQKATQAYTERYKKGVGHEFADIGD